MSFNIEEYIRALGLGQLGRDDTISQVAFSHRELLGKSLGDMDYDFDRVEEGGGSGQPGAYHRAVMREIRFKSFWT